MLAALLVATRLCHSGILWEGDAYPLAGGAADAARQSCSTATSGSTSRRCWRVAYLLFGALPGWPLRLAGALYGLLACWLAYGFARDLWSEREGLWAAGLLGFFLCFDFPSAVIPVASDLLMLAPHLAAVWLAFGGARSGAARWPGVAFWISPKGVFVAAACVLWNPGGVLALMAAGFAAVSARDAGVAGRRGSAGALLGRGVALGTALRGQPVRGGSAAQRHGAHARIGPASMRRWW